MGFTDNRAVGCFPKSIFNLVSLLKNRSGFVDNETPLEILKDIQLRLKETPGNLGVCVNAAFEFLDFYPFFSNARMLILNPSASHPENFIKVVLGCLNAGDVILGLLETPVYGQSEMKNRFNHACIFYSENSKIYCDGLEIDFDLFSKIVLYSLLNTLIFFTITKAA